MSSTVVITIVSPDSVKANTDALNTVPTTGTIVEFASMANVARYIDSIANGSLNITSFTTAVS